MEIAIPILALGGLFIINKEQKKTKKMTLNSLENFENMGKPANYLPNTSVISQNYPVENKKEMSDNVNKYENPNTATDKYFNQNIYELKNNLGINNSQNIPEIYSLSGNYLNSSQFKHNNMKPFYGSKIKGNLYHANMSESILDNMVGSGSQTIKKIEQAPLFKPESNMQYNNGTPNMSDFYQSRVVPAMKNSMVKPFESVNVAPGLNLGYGSEGSNGFNSGMEARDKWLPKTVDELRVATNPKQEYSLEGLEGPAINDIKKLGSIGKVQKYTPDGFFINTQDRWLTTTGVEKAGQLLPKQEVSENTNRNQLLSEYQGVAGGEKNGSYNMGYYEQSTRPELQPNDVGPSSSVGLGPLENMNNLACFNNYKNNRSENNQPDTFRSGFSQAIGSVIAPIMDIMRPTKKAENCNGVVKYGVMQSGVSNNYVINPNDITKTTNKYLLLFIVKKTG